MKSLKNDMLLSVLSVLFVAALTGCGKGTAADQTSVDTTPPADQSTTEQQPKAIALFDQGMENWESIAFGGEGEVSFKDGELNLDMGFMTGALYKGDAAKLFGESLENYEITLDAKRVQGLDMFLGLTFPVGKDGHVSLVLGGWAGTVNGISSLDGLNGSENATTTYKEGGYESDKWYPVRIRVTSKKIECWLEDKQIVDVDRADYSKYDTHGMVVDSKPFGLFTYETWGAYRDLKVRKLN